MPRPTPLVPASVPRFPGWAAALGPGIVWMALAQGSGELVWWPYLVAKYQLGFLFLLVPACLLQWPLTFEIGRYTLYTGESIWQGFFRLSRAFAIPLWLLMIASFLWFGAFASAGGTALAALTHWPAGLGPRGQSLFWAYLTIAGFFAALVLSPVLYRFIERFMMLVALVTVVGLVVAVTHPTVVDRAPQFLRGLFAAQRPLPRPFDRADAAPLLTAITFAGLGGFWTLFYSYWLREKGVGMAAHRRPMAGLLRHAADEPAPTSGFVPADEPDARPRLALWLRFLAVDSGIGIFGNILTTLMTCLLAYAVLAPRGLLPEGWDIAVVQSEFFGLRWGSLGKALFLVVAAAFLADTWLSTVDAVARVNADVLSILSRRARDAGPRRLYFGFLVALTLVTCATMPLAQPGPLIVLSAVLGFVGTVAFSFGVWVLNHRVLPRDVPAFARPGRLPRVLLAISCCAYLALALGYLLVELGLPLR